MLIPAKSGSISSESCSFSSAACWGSTNSILFLRWWSRLTFLPDFLADLSNFWKNFFFPEWANFARIFALTFGLRPSIPNLGKDRDLLNSFSWTTFSSSSSSTFCCNSWWFLTKFLPLRNPPLFDSMALGGLIVVVNPWKLIY